MENDSRKHKITFRMNDEEYDIFQKKFENSKSKYQGEFIRKMLLYGIVIRIDKKKFQNAIRCVTNISSNINQIAVRVNSTGSIYADDINEIKKDVKELWQQLRLFQSDVQKLMP